MKREVLDALKAGHLTYLFGIAGAFLFLWLMAASATVAAFVLGKILGPVWTAVAWMSGFMRPHGDVYRGVAVVLPCWFMYYALGREVVVLALKKWGLRRWLLYLVISVGLASSVAQWCDARKLNAYGFWPFWFFSSAGFMGLVRFWIEFGRHEEEREAPPGWVGEADQYNWRYNIWRGFILTILGLGNALFGIKKKLKADTSFGEAREATLAEIEKAGLL